MKPAGKAAQSNPEDAEAQLKGFIDKFEPKHQVLIRAVRKVLQKRMPTVNELV